MSSMEHAARLSTISVAKGGTLVKASLPLPYFELALGYIVGRLIGINLRELNRAHVVARYQFRGIGCAVLWRERHGRIASANDKPDWQRDYCAIYTHRDR